MNKAAASKDFSSSTTYTVGCVAKFSLNVPAAISGFVQMGAIGDPATYDPSFQTVNFLTVPADTSPRPMGTHTIDVVMTSIGGVAQTVTQSFKWVLSSDDCEDNGAVAFAAGDNSGVAIPYIVLGTAASSIPYSMVPTPSDCLFTYDPAAVDVNANQFVSPHDSLNQWEIAQKDTNDANLGPYTLNVYVKGLEGTRLSHVNPWTRDLLWRDPCNDDILTWTDNAEPYKWILNALN